MSDDADRRLIRIEEKLDEHTGTEHAELHATTRRIITALDGPETEELGLDGTPIRLTELGLVHIGAANGERLERIEIHLDNGIKTKMDPPVKVALITAAGAVIAGVAIATIPGLLELL